MSLPLDLLVRDSATVMASLSSLYDQLPQCPLVLVSDESWIDQLWYTLWMLPLWGAGLYMGLGVWMYWHPFVFLGIMAVLLTWAQLHERRMRRKDERQRADHAKTGQTQTPPSPMQQSAQAQDRASAWQTPPGRCREPRQLPHGEPPHKEPPHKEPPHGEPSQPPRR